MRLEAALALVFSSGVFTPATTTPDVRMEASYQAPGQPGASGAILVRFVPRSPEIRVNEEPPPRLRLEGGGVLLDRQPPARAGATIVEPDLARYLDPAVPVRFAVAPDPRASGGTHVVRASVSYAYCSKTQGWCKRATQPIEVEVKLP
jgi:hypothetical protein